MVDDLIEHKVRARKNHQKDQKQKSRSFPPRPKEKKENGNKDPALEPQKRGDVE
jgi:hypothetical protein